MTSSPYWPKGYRSEVDGLRAVAVVPVILFHAGFDLFAGGFVGVDVFFVISGYLITTILLGELAVGRFSLLTFYERRARRILPALFFMIFASLPVAWLLLLPWDMKNFMQSILAVAVFSSNILFWLESGYFDTAAELKPLLHTWSLGVEEQYYIFFPLLLMGAWAWGYRRIVMILAVIFVLSLALAEWQSVTMPAAAFFLLPTRAWELLIGVFVAMYFQRTGPALLPTSGPVAQGASLLGLGMIAFAIFVFDKTTPFPGLYALMPTLGVALILLFAAPGTLVHRLLSLRGMVGIGLISYSAYLWHQPLIAFGKHASLNTPGPLVMLGLCLLSLPLAWLSWRFIETPFRNKQRVSARRIALLAGSTTACLLCIGAAGHLTRGFHDLQLTYKISPAQAALYQQISEDTQYNFKASMVDDSACQFWTPAMDPAFVTRFEACAKQHGKAVVVLGDSHAMNLYNAFAKARVLPFMVGVAEEGCRLHDTGRNCPYAAFDTFIGSHAASVSTILYHQSGAYFVADSTGKVDSARAFEPESPFSLQTESIAEVSTALARLETTSTVPVTWLGPFREYRHNPQNAVFAHKYGLMNPVSVTVFAALDAQLSAHTAQTGLSYVSFDTIYDIPETAFAPDCFLYRDVDHFSRCGESVIAKATSTNRFLSQFLTDPAAKGAGQASD